MRSFATHRNLFHFAATTAATCCIATKVLRPAPNTFFSYSSFLPFSSHQKFSNSIFLNIQKRFLSLDKKPHQTSSTKPSPGAPHLSPSSASNGGNNKSNKNEIFKLIPENHVGCVQITSFNVSKVLRSSVPTIVYFYVSGHTEVAAFSKIVCEEIDNANKKHKALATTFNGEGDAKDLAIQLGVVDCLKEIQLSMQFDIDPKQIPVCMFIFGGAMIDRLVGLVDNSTMESVIDNFLKFSVEQLKLEGKIVLQSAEKGKVNNAPEGENEVEKDRSESINPCEKLLSQADAYCNAGEYDLAQKTYQNAADIGQTKVSELKCKLKLDKKKMTPELLSKLQADPHYDIVARSYAGKILCLLTRWDMEGALKLVNEIRTTYPGVLHGRRDVADAVIRAEMLDAISDREFENTYTQLKNEGALKTPYVPSVENYISLVKLTAGLYLVDRDGEGAVQRCLQLIKSEPQLLKGLKEAGVVAKEASLSIAGATPARKIAALVFEGLGKDNECVIEARKKLRAYLML